MILDDGVSLLGDVTVQLLAALIVLVNLLDNLIGSRIVTGNEQFNRLLTTLHASRRVDEWTNLEDDVANGNFALLQATKAQDASQSHTRVIVQALNTIVRQDAVFARERHQVGGDAHGQ